ncbi:YitT family protein [uncultured Chloroflexus sp.]|uniref:YitT family protein n=1 Tax=uncultured Chloroflexus sp. TaxID=214040 RepID=UPI00261BE025|nr:YitT family protein [uncultured Chloroflexus sp.]
MTAALRWRRIARTLYDYALLTIGALLSATAVRFFLVPNQVVTGGITGVAQLLNTFLGTPVGIVVLILNVPLLIAGWRYLGGAVFGARTLYTVVVMSLAIDGLAPFARSITNDPLLYSLYGGLIDGLGIGLVLRARGTTGGSDILARLIERRFSIQPGRSLLGFDTLVFTAALFSYGPEKILYALLVAFTASRTIDTVLAAGKGARQALIITSTPDPIRQAVLTRLGRGITQLEGIGGYTGASRAVLLCVVARTEIGTLKNIIATADPAAFVIVGEVDEVIGEGFGMA